MIMEAREERSRRGEAREEVRRCVEACGACEALTQNLWEACKGA